MTYPGIFNVHNKKVLLYQKYKMICLIIQKTKEGKIIRKQDTQEMQIVGNIITILCLQGGKLLRKYSNTEQGWKICRQ